MKQLILITAKEVVKEVVNRDRDKEKGFLILLSPSD